MYKFYISIIVAVVLFICLLIINRDKENEYKKIVTNIGIAIIAGILVYFITTISGDDTKPSYTPEPTQAVLYTKAPVDTPIPSMATQDENIDFNEKEYMEQYLTAMTKAINNNDFSSVERYLKLDSTAYTEQKDYITNYCQENKITEEIESVDILKIEVINKYTVVVDTYETYNITSPKKGNRTTSFNTQYTIENINGNWEISKIINN